MKNNPTQPTKPLVVKCPTCNKPVNWQAQQKSKPFCSERCKLIDLGEWATEKNVIAGDPTSSELPTDSNLGTE